MKTITETHKNRLMALAEEAESQKLYKIAEMITGQIEKNAVRDNESNYVYDSGTFDNDISDAFWTAVTRTADFHGTVIDPVEAQKLIDIYAHEFVKDLRKIAGLKPVGKYEVKLPGEVSEE